METYYIVVPCYNEQEVLPETVLRLGAELRELMDAGYAASDSRVLFVDDGSADNTWSLIKEAAVGNSIYCGISLDQNRGHQTALTEGLMAAREARAVSVSIDADLQDDVSAITEMAKCRADGAEIVCGVRLSRATDGFFKRTSARGYYALMRLFGSSLIYDHADFRLLSPAALDALALYHGDDLFLRGIITRLGFKCERVYYDRRERFAGESKYTLRKMLKLALRGAASGRMKPDSVPREPFTHTKEKIAL